jgi:hypothetical protein
MSARSLEIGGEEKDVLRTLNEVLDRTLALGAAVAASFDTARAELLVWLRESGLEAALTPVERDFLEADAPSTKRVLNMSWHSERLIVLLWALCKVEDLPSSAEQCSIRVLEELLPPYGDQSLVQFRESARLRSKNELFDAAVQIQALHAVARQRAIKTEYRKMEGPVDIEVIQERHRAINWLVGYSGQSWDEITADT